MLTVNNKSVFGGEAAVFVHALLSFAKAKRPFVFVIIGAHCVPHPITTNARALCAAYPAGFESGPRQS
jgi:hypothetical protein